MKLQPGDHVKYLNAVGGGVVTKVLDSKMVLVADKDGFEMPTLIKELVKVDPGDAGGRFFSEEYTTPGYHPPDSIGPSPVTEEEEDHPADLLDMKVVRNRTSEDIFLAFVPHDQKWLITGMLDIYLINNTSFDIIYNLFQRVDPGHVAGIDYGSLFANSRFLLATVNRDDVSRWTEGSMQFLFHKELVESVIPPFNSDFQIDGKKFYQEGSYRESNLIREKGIVVKILSLTRYLEKLHPEPKDAPSPAHSAAGSTGKEDRPLIFNHQTEDRKAVIDLHIHELVEDPSNLQKKEILEFQKDYFIKCLDGAMAYNFLNVVFIHGVGDGVLRGVLTDHLKKTGGIEWFDAPMALYGVGAVEVRIPHNR